MRIDKPFISVVIPIYNVEKHLQKAVDSILNQTYKDYEIILVDDCSLDNCPKICDDYVEKYSQIKVIHLKENGGLSNARNVGQSYAKGRYIFFMDSDDFVDNHLFEKIRESIVENPAQLIIFGAIEEYYDEKDVLKNQVYVKAEKENLKDETKIRKLLVKLDEKTLLGYAWNKVYDLEFLNQTGIKFEKITLIEDIVFNIKYASEISTLNILDITPYHYNRRINQSLTRKFVPEYFQLHYKRVKMLYDAYKKWGILDKKNERIFANRLFRYILSAIQRNCDKRAHMNLRKRYSWVKSLYNEPWISEMLEKVHYNDMFTNIIAFIFKKRLSLLVLAVGRGIYIITNDFPIFFSKIKQR